MFPAFWLTIQIGRRRIPLPLPLMFVLSLCLEALAFLPLIIVGRRRKQPLLSRVAMGFYLSRLLFNLMIYGRRFLVSVRGDEAVRVEGRYLSPSLILGPPQQPPSAG